MLVKMLGEKLYCGLDIGSQSIKTGVIKVQDPNKVEIMGVYESKIYGFKNGSVSDLGELTECIHKALQELTKKIGMKLRELQIGVGGELVESRVTSTVIPLIDRGSKIISNRDIKKVNHQACLLGIKMEEEILHDLPQNYSVDDNDSAVNPLGLYGRKLGVSSLMIITSLNRIHNISKAVQQAGFDVSNLFFSSFVSSKIVLEEDEIIDGCVLIDIGSSITSVLIFKRGILRNFSKIGLGGDNFTKAIAHRLNLPFDLAEEIKISYAGALSSDHHLDEEILVKRESSYIPFKREVIYQSIEPEIGK